MKKLTQLSQRILLSLALIFMSLTIIGCQTSLDPKMSAKVNERIEKSIPTKQTHSTEPAGSVSDSEIKPVSIYFLDTGNSDCIVIQNGSEAVLIDSGDFNDEENIIDFLKKKGIKTIEMAFMTHNHADHIGGIDAIVKEIPVKQLYVSNGDATTRTYVDFINAAMSVGLTPSVPLLNSKFEFGSGYFEVLSVANVEDANNRSIVLLYVNGEDRILFTGDIEAEIEETLKVTDIDLLKVSHHGSKTSSSRAFLKQITPKEAVITCGKDNNYGHPHKETLSKLESVGSTIRRTDIDGTIEYLSTGSGVTFVGNSK